MNNPFLSDNTLEEIFNESIFSTPAVSVRIEDTISEAVILLPHHLETFTDSLVVTRDDKPVGIIGGVEVLDQILKNPIEKLLISTKIFDIMTTNLVIVNTKSKFSELMKLWRQTKRAFAIIPNQYHGYSALSSRKILEIGTSFKIDTSIDVIPKRKISTFRKDEKVKQIISHMFENATRKLVLEGTNYFINDRIIIQKLAREYIHNVNDFLDIQGGVFDLEQAKIVSDNISISEACKIMQDMKSPYLMTDNRVISPWDIGMILGSC